MSAGKGDKPRPINKKSFDQNFDQIKWRPSVSEPVKTKKGKKTFVYNK